jgi:hypothetical protein
VCLAVNGQQYVHVALCKDHVDGLQDLDDLVLGAPVEIVDHDHDSGLRPVAMQRREREPQVAQVQD